jgi:coenzyme F420-reducing hydrogenase delta subunit
MPKDKHMDRVDILRLAAEAEIDPRTVKKAVENGIDSLRAEVDRVRLRDAAKRLGLSVG